MRHLLLITLLWFATVPGLAQIPPQPQPKQGFEYFHDLFRSVSTTSHQRALDYIDRSWNPSYEIMAVESLYFLQNSELSVKLLLVLQKHTRKQFSYDFNRWFEYIWNRPPTYDDNYYRFKSVLHRSIDLKFHFYFLDRAKESTIRLDEVRWGGVVQDGIPPLRNPEMIAAEKANYLNSTDVVFGIYINGEARAYPKRILAWHEMFTDTVGGVPVAGVYCTLCGTVILYQTRYGDTSYEFGTSGFLYRSNKLMYDKKTQSLWNTLWGQPVIGPLVGKDIQLEYLNVVTTTWGEWKKRHPDTQVLSLETGHDRDYGEGVAYNAYFADDQLMFNVPELDASLRNKDEILAIRLPGETDETLAISSQFLRRNKIYQDSLAGRTFTVFTDRSGAHRVYQTPGIRFVKYDRKSTVTDDVGNLWELQEDAIQLKGESLAYPVFPAHNAFWFGFKAAFPNTKLIK